MKEENIFLESETIIDIQDFLTLDNQSISNTLKCLSSETKNELAIKQRGSIYYARSYYYFIYFSFFKNSNSEILNLSIKEIIHNFMFDIEVIPSFPDGLNAQIFVSELRQFHSHPKKYSKILLKNIFSYGFPKEYFCLCTFPSLFGYFIIPELVDCAYIFVIELISNKTPSYILSNIILAMLLSSYSFTDALWLSIHSLVGNKRHMTTKEMRDLIAITIKKVAPLLPIYVYQTLQESHKHCKKSALEAVYKYLAITFKLWYNGTGEGKTFSCGDVLKDALIKNYDPKILKSFLYRKCGKVPVYPNYYSSCKIRNFSLCFSSRDFELFSKCFMVNTQIDFSMNFNSSYENEYWPYLINYFPKFDFHLKAFPDSSLLSSLFDSSLTGMINNDISDDQVRAIQKFKKNIQQSEKLINQKFNLKIAIDISNTLKKLKNSAFSYLFSSLIQYNKINDLETAFHTALSISQFAIHSNNELFFLIFQCCLNKLTFNDCLHPIQKNSHCQRRKSLAPSINKSYSLESFTPPSPNTIQIIPDIPNSIAKVPPTIIPPKIKKLFSKFQEEIQFEVWNKFHYFRGNKFIFELATLLTRRQITHIGAAFEIMNFIFNIIATIENYYNDSSFSWVDIMSFILKVSHYESLFEIFVIFEKIIFKSDLIIQKLDPDIVEKWKLFFKTMWANLITNDELFHGTMTLDFGNPFSQ